MFLNFYKNKKCFTSMTQTKQFKQSIEFTNHSVN